jgi:hypothetical protein
MKYIFRNEHRIIRARFRNRRPDMNYTPKFGAELRNYFWGYANEKR